MVKEDWDNRLSTHSALGEGEVRYETVVISIRPFTSTDEDVIEQYLYALMELLFVCCGNRIPIAAITDW